MSVAWARFLSRIESVVPRRMLPFWNAPAGPKTIFFWAPAFKWSTALAATGLIWSRYSMVIIPKNWLLFSVNIGLGITGLNQLGRIAYYRYTHPELFQEVETKEENNESSEAKQETQAPKAS
ncbi:Mitochondrial pyruvate carrier 2 [Exaiptasia diaphana]|nr:Mitochondrial pyruvate carrier 2 [Exaiptasia diaphana]